MTILGFILLATTCCVGGWIVQTVPDVASQPEAVPEPVEP